MNNNKICSNCNTVNGNDSLYCSNCGTNFSQDNNIIHEQNNCYQNLNNSNVVKNNNSEGNIFGIISLVLYFCGSTISAVFYSFLPDSLSSYLSTLGGVFPLVGIVVMIVGRVKYPQNKLLKVTMWVIISTIILMIVLFIIFIAWCYVTCNSSDLSGCN